MKKFTTNATEKVYHQVSCYGEHRNSSIPQVTLVIKHSFQMEGHHQDEPCGHEI